MATHHEEERRRDEGYEARSYKGPSIEELGIRYRNTELLAKGGVSISLILTIALGALFFYGYREQSRQHDRIERRMVTAICISMYDFSERRVLREAWLNNKAAVKHWCPDLD
jgi:hypothetical protein